MRIFQVLGSSANAAVANNRTWYRNLYEPLIELGHDVVLFSVDEGQRAMQSDNARVRAAFGEKLYDSFCRAHARKPFDLFFSYLMDGMIEPGVIDRIRKIGVPTCNFSCNNAHQFYLVDELSPHFDYSLHSEKDAREKFLKIGAKPIWWPMASNPKYFKPMHVPRNVAVSFVGANYALRARYIAHLLENGIDVHAYGPGWVWGESSHWRAWAKRYVYLFLTLIAQTPKTKSSMSGYLADLDFRRGLSACFPLNMHHPVSDDELIALYSRSHVSLGFLEVYDEHNPSRPVTQHLHLREFEGPMSGALYCTNYSDELAEMFEPDKEMIVYRNQHELLDKVRYYLAHPTEAEQARKAGHIRALRDHTYQRRFKSLFHQIGLEDR
jgi:hypothetical protein